MAQLISSPGPYAGLPDGFSEQAGGVLQQGHLMMVATAYLARDILTSPASADSRRQAWASLRTLCRCQIREHVPVNAPNTRGLDPRGTWFNAENDTTRTGPHFNVEDFNGSALLQIMHQDAAPDHADWPAGLLDDVRESIAQAALCGERRSVRLSYTNPTAMGIEVSALAGELLARPAMVEYARARLEAWRQFTEEAGTFEEFNSSCYGGVTLPHIAYLVEKVRDRDVRARALYMERLYVDHIADFLHAPTGELNMPQSRSYHDHFAGTLLHDYLSHVLAERGLAVAAMKAGLPVPPPRRSAGCQYYSHATQGQLRRLLRTFARPVERRVFCEWIGRYHVGPLDQAPPVDPAALSAPPEASGRRRELVSWRGRRHCVGSVSEIDCWNQRRAAGGFIRGASGTTMFLWQPLIEVAGVEFDDQAQHWPVMEYFNLATGQRGTTVIGGVSGTPIDGGWLCGCHWRQRVSGAVGGVRVDLGFVLSGPAVAALTSLPPLVIGRPWRLEVDDHVISLLFLGGRLGGGAASPAIERTDGGWRLVLLRRDGLVMDWSHPPEVGLGWVLDISPAGGAPVLAGGRCAVAGTLLDVTATVNGVPWRLHYAPPGLVRLTEQAVHFS